MEEVRLRFGALQVIDNLSVQLSEGEAVGVVGPHGAGKTTMLNHLAGQLRPDAGRVRYDGRDVTALDARRRCLLGIARTYQIPQPFPGMSVFENALVGATFGSPGRSDAEATAAAVAGLLPRTAGSVAFDGAELTGVPAHRRVALGISLVPEGRRIFPSLSVEENLLVGAQARRTGPWTVPAVLELFPLLAGMRRRGGGQLSGGEQQALAIGRGLMANPRLLLLDEVSLGLAPIVVRRIYEALPAVGAAGTTVVVIEQDIGQALRAADRVYCLLEGRVALEGAPRDLDRDRIAAAYFGVRA